MEISKEEIEALKQFRRDNFAVDIEDSNESTDWKEYGEIHLSITHNGTQWQSVALTPEERLKVLRALLMYESPKK